ncbi:MAG: folylpolyglutamate synthase/dihydrofolate synthase family protein [Cyanobacteria bacterium J06638_20]
MASIPNDDAISQRLGQYGRFGVHLGLERIQRLLAALGSPHERVPILHVAGTNGKGSVCAYLSSVLTQAGYRVGRYTSPHLVSWCERICLDEQPIAPTDLEQVLTQVEAAIASDRETPTQFEVFTAAAWLYFAQQSVDIAVVEVGLGGRLDATNVVDQPLVSVITSIGRDHWQQLGPTLADIAGEKAGILKPQCPAVIGPLPPEAETVVLDRAAAQNCPIMRPQPAQTTPNGQALYRALSSDQADFTYTLPFAGDHQLTNSAIAIATLQALREQGWQIVDAAIQSGIAQATWPGRLQWLTWQAPDGQAYPWLIDGAHNTPAAKVLREYVDAITQPNISPLNARLIQHLDRAKLQQGSVTWLMGMLTTKDHADVFKELLRPGDRLHLVPVPDHSSMPPTDLQQIALTVCPDLASCETYNSLADGLQGAVADASGLQVLCGSLYLIGHFFAVERDRVIT